MQIVSKNVNDIFPYENNAKIHTREQIEQIKKSIQLFGFNDPIALDIDNVVIEGHGRLIAAEELGMKQVPCIYLTHMNREEKKAYILAHNKLTMNTGFDFDTLDLELDSIDMDMSQFGFEDISLEWDDGNIPELSEDEYDAPEHEMLKCPSCGHVDRKIHFKKQ